jgi:putative AdoMet-dependent methyltransferase
MAIAVHCIGAHSPARELPVKKVEDEKTWNFDHWANRYDEMIANDSQHYYARYNEVLDTVVEVANISSGKRVLDIGTGTGNLALRCLARGAVVVGLDPSKSMLIKAREKIGCNSRAEFCRVDEPFLHIPYPDSSFDAVISTYAYHHVPHRLRPDSVCEMVRVLEPGGSWALGDLVFENEQAEKRALREYSWLEEEYFARIKDLRDAFAEYRMKLNSRQFTPVTWVLWAVKPIL